MKTIKTTKIKKLITKLISDASFNLPPDVLNCLLDAAEKEENKTARKILNLIIDNSKFASSQKVPLCQDCGTVYVDFLIGSNICIEKFGEIQNVVDEAVMEAYTKNYLRTSIVNDPLFERNNTFSNTPSIINFVPLSDLNCLDIKVSLKGGGSDNCSYLNMLNPSGNKDDLIKLVKELVISNASKCCPPIIIGIGIGASASKVTELARWAAFRELYKRNSDKRYEELENKILNEVNLTNIGPAGLGGKTTALAVNIEYAPTHMATLPVAIFFVCHSLRRASLKISFP